jgi:hypothetical protein
MASDPFPLPPCGIFVGSGIYNSVAGYLTVSGRTHTCWLPETRSHLEWLERMIEDNQGNLAQFWGYSTTRSAKAFERMHALEDLGIQAPEPDWANGKLLHAADWEESKCHGERLGAGLLKCVQKAKENGIYSMFLYADCLPEWSQKFQEDGGKFYLGYDLGEIFTFRLEEEHLADMNRSELTLKDLADDLVRRVSEVVVRRKKNGWGHILATSSNFYVDYEIAGGADIPTIEDFAFSHLNIASALSRGLYKQYDLPTWGAHLAHEHYSWIPYSSPYKFPLLKAAFYHKYMGGAKILINESGNWYLQAQLCEDSPMFETPRLEFGDLRLTNPERSAPHFEEAKKSFPKINYDSPVARRYREVISDFYDFVKEHGTPAGQPEVTVAVIKGNYDLSYHEYSPNAAIAGMYEQAEENPFWYHGAPERGWNIVKDTFFPRPPVVAPHLNRFLSGTPYGMVDIVSFAKDKVDAQFLLKNYKALLFSGWNTCSDKQYSELLEYVREGGTLFAAIPHFSTNITRNHASYGVEELVRGGDLSELCGVVVKGKGTRFFWAIASEKDGELGFKFPRRFGIMTTCLGKIEIVDPEAEVLVVEDEAMEPLLLRRKLGKGTVYFLNSWAYPGALDHDEGPGGTLGSTGLIGAIYAYIAKQNRGNVWMTGDGENPGPDNDYIAYSYFPEDGRICLQNIDFDRPRSGWLHHFGVRDRIELTPGEFRMIETARSS